MKKSCALPKSVFPVKFKIRSVSHALREAQKLIHRPRSWIKGDLAAIKGKDEPDSPNYFREAAEVKDPAAEAFCALGSLQRVNTRFEKKAVYFLAKAINEEVNDGYCDA